MINKNNILGVILAGGKSSRMGKDKGLLLLNDKSFVDHIYEELIKISHKVVVISNNPQYENKGYEVQRDIYKGLGPIGGIHTAMKNWNYTYYLVAGCDNPELSEMVLKGMTMNGEKGQVILIKNVDKDRHQPFPGLYHQTALPVIENAIKCKELKMQELLAKLNAYSIKGEDYDHDFKNWNINTKEDYKQLCLE